MFQHLPVPKIVCGAALCVACGFGLVGCGVPPLHGSASHKELVEISDTASGTAVTVSGESVGEAVVTSYIEDFRAAHDLVDDDRWSDWLARNDETPTTVREQAIDFFVNALVIQQKASGMGISVSEQEVDEQIQSSRDQFDSDEEWTEALRMMGLNETTYKLTVESSLLEEKVKSELAIDDTDADLALEYANAYALAYDGSKRSSQIVFDADDADSARDVLSKLKTGELEFADAVDLYSVDDSTKSVEGDMGWDALNAVPNQQYSNALSQLEPGQLSDLVVSDDGIRIILCTDIFHAPEQITSLDQLPEEFVNAIKASISSTEQTEAFASWLETAKADADIKITDMPEGLSYDVAPKLLDSSAHDSAVDDQDEVDLSATTAIPTEAATTVILDSGRETASAVQ